MSDVTAKVYAKNGNLIFEGLLADAEKYIADNFPRMHSEQAGPDYTVITDPAGQAVAVPEGYPKAINEGGDTFTESDLVQGGDPAVTDPVT